MFCLTLVHPFLCTQLHTSNPSYRWWLQNDFNFVGLLTIIYCFCQISSQSKVDISVPARMSASSMKCVVRRITRPGRLSFNNDHKCRLEYGSIPAVGSSKKITCYIEIELKSQKKSFKQSVENSLKFKYSFSLKTSLLFVWGGIHYHGLRSDQALIKFEKKRFQASQWIK